MDAGIREVLQKFFPGEEIVSVGPHGSGHINHTFAVETAGGQKYILQKINTEIFKDVEGLMENVVNVTDYLRRQIAKEGGDPERGTMQALPTVDGKYYFKDAEGGCFRVYRLIDDVISLDQAENEEALYASGLAFGRFQAQLADYPAAALHETIPGFHDTKARFEVFRQAVEKDVCNRAASVKKEIDFVLEREDITGVFGELLAKGEIPLRVTHNDTKLNNIMMDNETGKGICVIDLDTVMPGLAMNDFGDSIRFGASTALEDEQDLDKVWCDMDYFEAYTRGFIEGCGGRLTPKEIELLPMGAKVMTFECGMRFLTDYLQGDTYFKIHRPGQNLDRCRTQFKLVEDMEKKWDIMNEIVRKYS